MTPGILIPWLANQLGSVLFVLLLGQADISMAVPVANAISIAANAVVSVKACVVSVKACVMFDDPLVSTCRYPLLVSSCAPCVLATWLLFAIIIYALMQVPARSRLWPCTVHGMFHTWHVSHAALNLRRCFLSCVLLLQVDMLLAERYSMKLMLPGCLLVGAGVLLCTL